MRALGVDPGLKNCGWGVVDLSVAGFKWQGSGTWYTDDSLSLGCRLDRIFVQLSSTIAQFQPNIIGLEKVYMGKNTNSAMTTAMVVGHVHRKAYMNDCEVLEFTPSQLKKAVTGNGKASKDEMYRMLVMRLGHLPDNTDHAWDAIGCAITALNWNPRLEGAR